MHWYVNVENQTYGPYSDDQMRGFVAEGRIIAASLISNTLGNGFYSAVEFDAFNLWHAEAGKDMLQPLMAVDANSGSANRHTPMQPTPQSGTPTSPGKTDTAKSCVFLIMAEIRSGSEMAFLQAIQGLGQDLSQDLSKVQRISDTVWLVRTRRTAEQIRNTLSQTLNQQDRLFILDSGKGKTAWFNIGADLDHRIRELWDEDTD